MLSNKALALKPSPTLAMAQKARELAQSGKDVVSLTVGEPDWPTFSSACEAGIQAIQSGFTKYTAVNGIPELRTAIAEQTQSTLGISYKPSQVCVGTGAKFVLFSALQMLLNEGDETIIPSPYWVSYPVMAELAGGKVVSPDCGEKENFKLTAEKLQACLTPKSKVLILCSPSNPTGLVYTSEELEKLGKVILQNKNLFIISDDIYNRLSFTQKVSPHLLQVCPQLVDRTLIVNGASKSYSMTGWRIGWGLGPEKLIQVMTDYMSQSTSSVSGISQKAALSAILNGEADLQKSVQTLKEKMNWCYEQLKTIKGFSPIKPDGAFYFWVKISDFFASEGLRNSKDIAEKLLEKYFVATVPGSEFGCEGYLRLSYATSQSNLEKALQRFKQFSMDHLR